jgi:pre-rRNA-processing protein TSR1
MHASNAGAQSKLNRRNHAKQIQLQKRQSLLSAIRIFGGVDGAPRIVAVVPLCEDISSHVVVSALSNSLAIPAQTDQEPLWKIKFVIPFSSAFGRLLCLILFIRMKGGAI